uniref:Uncharacterized protein n=1 Tax=Lotus japonicus TaxID=34305 RepID=I3S060_LOTJA|nr:unknown [Lotus japonicus]
MFLVKVRVELYSQKQIFVKWAQMPPKVTFPGLDFA